MTKEEKDKIINFLDSYRSDYVEGCEKRRASEQGKIEGANYMFRELLSLMWTVKEDQE